MGIAAVGAMIFLTVACAAAGWERRKMVFELVEVGTYPRVEAVGAEWRVSGGRVSYQFYDWMNVGGVVRRRIVVEVRRPLFGLLDEQRTLRHFIQGGPREKPSPREVAILQ